MGDPYFPLDGNGGYDVRHYLLDVRYTPDTDVLTGLATVSARATQNLSAFNLDLRGLTVRSITVDGHPARFSRAGGELTVTPRRGLPKGRTFVTVVRYDGVPELLDEPALGLSGVFPTDDGAVIVGAPHVAATWFPVNDHPSDKAAFTVRATVPAGLTAVSNGELVSQSTRGGWTTWAWAAKEPMAPHLATTTIGRFDLRAYREGGIRYWDAIDPDLSTPVAAPRTGAGLAFTQVGAPAYKRLTRTVDVPATGSQLSFWVDLDTTQENDYFFVEAHTLGRDDWTTLPDANGHTNEELPPGECRLTTEVHPFLLHYWTPTGEHTCAAAGSTGTWAAASGSTDGYQQWSVDLTRFAGTTVEVSLTYLTHWDFTLPGVFIDDVVVSNGPGTTSFEADDDTMDGWVASGAPAGSQPNPNNWIAGTSTDLPASTGQLIERSFARQPEILRFLSGLFGPYPFSAAGGIVDDAESFTFAMENQTRPIYDKSFFFQPGSGDAVVAHELAHQWFGNSVALRRWDSIWLSEGFATYAQWLWDEQQGLDTAQQRFDRVYATPADSPYWQTVIGDPGPERLFASPIYSRGAMTLHELRRTVGDRPFFEILRSWAATHKDGNVTTAGFIAHAERIAGRDLRALFDAWLFTSGRPEAPTVGKATVTTPARSDCARTGWTAPPVASTSRCHPDRKGGRARDSANPFGVR
ncbi:MAG TPA: M1 family metallopeptidase [Catenuloplanes sp.]